MSLFLYFSKSLAHVDQPKAHIHLFHKYTKQRAMNTISSGDN